MDQFARSCEYPLALRRRADPFSPANPSFVGDRKVAFCNGLYRVNPLSSISSPKAGFCPQSIGVAA